MIHLRPHQVPEKVEERDRLAVIYLISRNSQSSMLDRAILVSLLKILKPRKIFEIGTYMGETALILAANSEAAIYTLDLDEKLFEAQTKLDETELVSIKKRFPTKLIFQDTPYESRIKTLVGDSTTFDFSPYFQQMDLIIIDGGHHIDIVKSDTQQAFKMLHPNNPGCILWHDYNNPRHQITEYLDNISNEIDLYHVVDSAYAFYLNNCNLTFSSEENLINT
jgi:hypothetical protein